MINQPPPQVSATLGAPKRGSAQRSTPYLHGVRQPLSGEADPVTITPSEGACPSSLKGRSARYSTNPQLEPIERYHWFDGDGVVHGIHIADGVARYSTYHYIQTPSFHAERAAGEAMWTRISEAPDPERAEIEDGGWIFSILSHPERERSKRILTDAERLTQGVVVAGDLPRLIPVGFHAGFVSL